MQTARPSALSERAAEMWLRAILTAYLLLGAMYAVLTPAWQAPDEPAHFNYARYVAEHGRLPELHVGDYPAEYLEMLKARRFPPELSIEPIRYESYQPPLYYVLAALVYRLADAVGWPTLLALRGFSVILGAACLLVGYRAMRALLPAEPELALGATAFAATLPMQIAITAGVNNDVLIRLIIVFVAYQLLRMRRDDWTPRQSLALGALLGLAFLTKLWAYLALGLALAALVWDTWSTRNASSPDLRWALRHVAIMLGIALLVALPWLFHNAALYGLGDPLGLARHDQVVLGQLTTREYLAQHGAFASARALVTTTFRSFWGQFGWMGVLLDKRVYLALATLSGLAAMGFLLWLADVLRRKHASNLEGMRGPALIAIWAILTVLGYLAYNLKYVQPQGRYLFFALVPWGLFFTLGIRQLLRAPLRIVLILFGVAMAVVFLVGLVTGDIKGLSMALLVGASGLVFLGRWIERRWPGLVWLFLYLGMAVLAVVCLRSFILPQLTPG